jgi:GntR family transcriptional repressor for pyruvate dehydrogenase complex
MVNKKAPDTNFTLRTIRQTGVVEQIIEMFKESLIRGELRPGQRLPSETELSHQLGVGRSAVREAMKVLQAVGVVDIRHGDGTYIVEGTSDTMLSPLVFAVMMETDRNEELFELRRLIEIGYCELTAQKATDEDWATIEKAASALESYIESGGSDIEQFVQLDLHFHFTVLEATHNPLVIKIGKTVEELFFASIRKTYISREENTRWAVESHRRIIQAMRDGNPQHIRQAIETSLLYWKEEV